MNVENQDLLQFEQDNSSLHDLEKQHKNLFSDDLLQFSSINLDRTGSFSDRPATELTDDDIKAVKNSSEIANSVLGKTPKWEFNLTTDNLSKIPDDADSLTGNTTSASRDLVLKRAIATAKKQLESFANDENYLKKMNLAFGDAWHPQKADTLIQDLAVGTMPKIEILPTSNLNGNGAFGEGTIYLSEKFLTKNVAHPEAVANVLLEEMGHYVDRELNSIDSPGDEGDIFSRLVRDENINEAELGALKTEDDSGTIFLNGKETFVELAEPPYPGYLLQYEPGESLSYDANVEAWQQRMKDRGWNIDVDGLYGSQSESIARQFQQEKGLDVDGIVGPKTWEAAFRTDNVTDPSSPSPPSSSPTGFFKDDIVKIAKQEWERFERGALKETEEGAWQRVADDYWQTDGIDRTDIDTSAEVGSDDNPWSAAFISWVMKEAGAGDRFEYSASHSTYITDAIADRKGKDSDALFFGYKLNEYSPEVGDLVSYSRQDGVGFDTPAPYKSHSDIVVAKRKGEIDVIGGNVSDSVTLKTLKTDSEGRLIDTSYDWFAVLGNQVEENTKPSPPPVKGVTPDPRYPEYSGEQTENSKLSSNMRSFLDTIAYAEGTYKPEGYRIIVGYDEFTDFSDHPRQYVSEANSTAAGRYQFLERTWDATKAALDLPDFSPKSQDLGAVDLIDGQGAVDEVESGKFADAVSEVNNIWASLPGSPYGQPTRDLGELQAFYEKRLTAYGVA